METRQYLSTHLSVQRTVAVVEQALRESGAEICHRESNRVLARTRASGAPPDAEIEVKVEACLERSRIIIVGRPPDATPGSGRNALKLRPLVDSIRRIEGDLFPEGWQPFGELLIRSGTLRIADPTNFSDAVKIEGIAPALYPLFCQREQINGEFAFRVLKRIRLRIHPGPVDARQESRVTRLRFPGGLNGIAILGDGEDYKEHWSESRYRERFIEEVARRPDAWEAVVHDFFGDVLAIHSDSCIIGLGEAIASYEQPDDSELEQSVGTVRLFGGGELRGIEFEF